MLDGFVTAGHLIGRQGVFDDEVTCEVEKEFLIVGHPEVPSDSYPARPPGLQAISLTYHWLARLSAGQENGVLHHFNSDRRCS